MERLGSQAAMEESREESREEASFRGGLRRDKLAGNGGSSSAGRASVCGTECRGFNPRLPPQLDLNLFRLRVHDEKLWDAKSRPQTAPRYDLSGRTPTAS
jgi:hypothetical protein